MGLAVVPIGAVAASLVVSLTDILLTGLNRLRLWDEWTLVAGIVG